MGHWWLVVIVALVLTSLWRPWRLLARLVYSLLIGGILVGGLNLAGPYLGVSVPLNALTALIAGVLGLPGLAALALLQLAL